MSNEEKAAIAALEEAPADDDPRVLPPLVQDEIGRRLRALYGRMAEEPLPDKFVKLLQELSGLPQSEPDK